MTMKKKFRFGGLFESRRGKLSGEYSDKIFGFFNSVFLIVMFVIALYPIVFVLSASISDPQMVNTGKMLLWPVDITWSGYEKLLIYKDLWVGYGNTVFYTVCGTVLNLLATLPCAYALSRRDFRPRNMVMIFFMFTMFFGGGMIPTYLNLRDLKLLDTPWVMFVPSAISVTNFIIMRNYFTHSVPNELIEAAYMEGATELQILRKIVLPLSKPILGVLTIYYMSGHWNAYFSAIIYLSDEKLMPLQVFLRRILIMGGMEGMSTGSTMTDSLIYESLKYGIIVVSTLPMLIGYLLVQKSFKKGIMMGSLKG